jgi:hypothetical protein
VTLPPIDSWQVRGVAGPKYKVGPRCSNPTCGKIAEHAHHMWRRSLLAGDFAWVELPDGKVLGNLTGLCPLCHDKITGRVGGHKAAIRLSHPDGVMWWCTIGDENSGVEYEFVAPLDPQPPTREAFVASPADSSESEENSCPTCGQPRARHRKKTPARSARRARKTWPVKVPADAEEDGAEVLDSLTEDLAPLLGVEPDDNGAYTSGRYYVLVPALYYAQQQRDDFVRSILGK